MAKYALFANPGQILSADLRILPVCPEDWGWERRRLGRGKKNWGRGAINAEGLVEEWYGLHRVGARKRRGKPQHELAGSGAVFVRVGRQMVLFAMLAHAS